MLKRKLATIVAAVLAVCSIGLTVFADGVGTFKGTVKADGGYGESTEIKKNDDLYAVVYVDKGLESGDTYVSFQVMRVFAPPYSMPATNLTDLWINGRHTIDYISGAAEVDKNYYLRFRLEPQKNATQITVSGTWTP